MITLENNGHRYYINTKYRYAYDLIKRLVENEWEFKESIEPVKGFIEINQVITFPRLKKLFLI